MTQMGFYFNQTRCTGCYTCAVACKDWYDIDAGPVNRMRIKSIERGEFPDLFAAYLASPCYHCANPPCLKACPDKAILKRESDGIVVVDKEKCSGTGSCPKRCLKACPWDAPQFGPKHDEKMEKCDFCLTRLDQGQQPVCMEACPMFAIDIGPLDQLHKKYGNPVNAQGFSYSERFKPSAVFKPKKNQ